MRLIDADAMEKEAERLYGEWNKAMAGAEGARQINAVYKKQELCKAVAEVARSMTTYATPPYPAATWIPTAEQLPDDENRVLCCVQNKAGRKNIILGYYMGGMWRCGMNNNVVAWMPLPKPYAPNCGAKMEEQK